MPEVTHACQQERDASFFAQSNGVLVPLRSSGLDDAGDAGIGKQCRAVVEGEEGIRREGHPLERRHELALISKGQRRTQSFTNLNLENSRTSQR